MINILVMYVIEYTCEVEYRAESGDAEEDRALLQDMPSLPRLLWKLPWNELDDGPGEAGDAVSGDLDLTDSARDLRTIKLLFSRNQRNMDFFYNWRKMCVKKHGVRC